VLPRYALLALGIALGCEGAPPEPPDAAQPGAPAPSHFAIEGVLLSDSQSSLSVGRLIGRKRTGGAGLFTYHDLRELVLTNAELVLDSPSASLSIAPVIDYARALSSVVGEMQPADPGSELVTRLVFEGLTIRLRHPVLRELRFSAEKARLNLDSNMLVLEEGFRVSPPSGQPLAAPVAVLAERHDGLYLPRGYWVDARRESDCRISVVISPQRGAVPEVSRVCAGPALQASAFLTLDRAGALSRAATVPAIDYDDPVDRREQIVLSKFADRLPSEWKPLLLMMMQTPDVPIRLQGIPQPR
jgi:hypothetical protein